MHLSKSTLAALALGLASVATPIALAGDPPQSDTRFFTVVTGSEEVPPVDSDGFGRARFTLLPNGEGLRFQLLANGLEEILFAHIHLAPTGVNGPIVAFLFESAGSPVTQNGMLSQGVITAEDLVGPLTGMPLSALIDAIIAGNAYVNVHTMAHPTGEIRGQIRRAPGQGSPKQD